MNDSRDAHVMSGAYVLHALDADERAEVEAAMEHSEELRGEIAELSDTAVMLGMAVQPEQPPAALRTRLLAQIAETPQLAPLASEPVPVSLPAGRHRVTHRARWYRRPAVLMTAVAAAFVLFVGGLAVDHLVESSSQPARFAAITASADVQQVKTAVAGGGVATAYWSRSQNESAIVLTGVTSPDSGHVLQVWRLEGSKAVSEGLYQPAPGDDYEVLDGTLTAGQHYAVTVEPAGGSKQPTTKPIVSLPTSA